MQDGKLSGKFIVERADGTARNRDRFFVLNYASDPYARAAMLEYARQCRDTHPSLADDIEAVVEHHKELDERRRKNSDRPARGTHGGGGSAAADDLDALLAVAIRAAATDHEFASALNNALSQVSSDY